MTQPITLISHAVCHDVKRIAIALAEKGVEHDRTTIDLAMKPDWFLVLSPLGHALVLKVGTVAIFESAATLEFLQGKRPDPFQPTDPVERTRHRAWIGFWSECLSDIVRLYSAPAGGAPERKAASLYCRFRVMQGQLCRDSWFTDDRFSLVDAVYAPVFRHFDTFDRISDFFVFDGLPSIFAWRHVLANGPSVRNAISPDYDDRLSDFPRRKGGALSQLMAPVAQAIQYSA